MTESRRRASDRGPIELLGHPRASQPLVEDREIDLAIAAHALERSASLWTLNREDFADIPGLELIREG